MIFNTASRRRAASSGLYWSSSVMETRIPHVADKQTVDWFLSFEPNVRAILIVGFYLQTWAFMEHALDEVIAKALGLTGLQNYVLRSELAFHNKINLTRTLVDLSTMMPNEKQYFDNSLNHMSNYSANRNIIAHDPFSRSTSTDGVKFLVYKSKGKLKFPEFDWPIFRFLEEIAKIGKCNNDMQSLNEKIRKINPTSLAEILTFGSPPAPSSEQSATSALGLLYRQLQADHTSATNPATPETEIETPPSPQG